MLSTSVLPTRRPTEQATEPKVLFTIDADFDAPSVSKPPCPPAPPPAPRPSK